MVRHKEKKSDPGLRGSRGGPMMQISPGIRQHDVHDVHDVHVFSHSAGEQRTSLKRSRTTALLDD
ncbi:hypothetical protein EYF80_017009 [Liparis tanakae]|uniref:Uncharacterized protein n=1 Tax=Liparis tanakae TaxID=230148 RepID=A0A4Z2I5J2_9TELE|nr:hypothetical protein EYF80_017009 [Liparis tanakae]